jgi:hypothetical protein
MHRDSLGNLETLTRGQIQFTSAGTGIQHSEFNADKKVPVHFLQIWAKPTSNGLKPGYQTGTFEDARKQDTLLPVITPTGENGTIKINQDLRMFASILSEGRELSHSLEGLSAPGTTRKAYLHVPEVPGSVGVTVTGTRADGTPAGEPVKLGPGDGAFVEGLKELRVVGGRGAAKAAAAASVEAGGEQKAAAAAAGGAAGGAGGAARTAEFVLMDFAWP